MSVENTAGKSDPVHRADFGLFPGLGLWPMVALAIVGSLVGGVLLDSLRGKFATQPQTYANPTAEQEAQYAREWRATSQWGAAVNTGTAGAAIAALLVCGVGVARSRASAAGARSASPVSAAVGWSVARIVQSLGGVMVAAVLGGVLVGIGGVIGERYHVHRTESLAAPGIAPAIVMQLTFWVPQAVAVVLGSAVVLGGFRLVPMLSSALCGAAVTSGLVPVLGAVLFLVTSTNTKDGIPPDTLGHCLVMTLAGSLVTALVIWAATQPARPGMAKVSKEVVIT